MGVSSVPKRRDVGDQDRKKMKKLRKHLFTCLTLLLVSFAVNAMEYSHLIILKTLDGRIVGMILSASPGFSKDHGECVFSLIPESESALHTLLGIEVSEREVAGEHLWKRSGNRIEFFLHDKLALTVSGADLLTQTGQVIGTVSVPND